jgi:hypothetical protein
MASIPTSVIGLLCQILPERYTAAEIESLFLYAGAPESVPDLTKSKKVQAWLRQTNMSVADPLKVLGVILEDFMQRKVSSRSFWDNTSDDDVEKLKVEKGKIREALSQEGLSLGAGGRILKSGSTSTLSLEANVKKHGLASVDIEIQRALAQIESDPHAAAQYAGNVLEASLKAYLDHKGKIYTAKDGLAELWRDAAGVMGLRPVDWDDKDLKKIASGLNNIVDGIMHLRNKKSGAHGKSEEETRTIAIRPRHARLAIHASHTVAAYVLELIE